ncbi:protein of unknown function [Ruminococcaceae bacterium BL-6]|nr:protein of unknown function [Ruminococcaceae bacterium BL-6]
MVGCSQAVRQRTLTPSSRRSESCQPSQKQQSGPERAELLLFVGNGGEGLQKKPQKGSAEKGWLGKKVLPRNAGSESLTSESCQPSQKQQSGPERAELLLFVGNGGEGLQKKPQKERVEKGWLGKKVLPRNAGSESLTSESCQPSQKQQSGPERAELLLFVGNGGEGLQKKPQKGSAGKGWLGKNYANRVPPGGPAGRACMQVAHSRL